MFRNGMFSPFICSITFTQFTYATQQANFILFCIIGSLANKLHFINYKLLSFMSFLSLSSLSS